MQNSDNSESTQEPASDSLLARRENLQAVLEAFKGPLWRGLLVVFQAERDAQALVSVYSDNDRERHERNGVVKWLDAVLAGILEENYKGQAEAGLGLDKPIPTPGMVEGGSQYMESDGLDESV